MVRLNIFSFIKSLSSKIAIIMALTLFIMLIILNFLILNIFKSSLLDSAYQKGQDLTAMFTKMNRSALIRSDYFSLEQSVKELQSKENILFAQVFDKDMFLLTPSSKPFEVSNARFTFIYEETVYDDMNNVIGYAAVGLCNKQIHELLKRNRIIFYTLSFIIVMSTCLLLLALINIVVHKPIKTIIYSVGKISSGDLDHEIKIRSNDELGNLANNFNIMTSKLKDSISTIRCIIDSMPSALMSIDKEYKVLQWNSSAEDLTGISIEKAVSKNVYSLFPELARFKKQINMVLGSNKPMKLNRVQINKDKNLYDIHIFPLKIEFVNGLVIRIDDITEKEKRENLLFQAQKMESIGNLAGGLAHNLNNILAGILGTTTFLEYKLNKNAISNELLAEKLKIIDTASQRAAEMVRELLSMSGKKQDIEYNPHDINTLVKNVIKICENTFDKAVDIQAEYNNRPSMVLCNSNQIEQVILNICINAYHAMTIMRNDHETKGGSIKIKISHFTSDIYFKEIHANAVHDEYILLNITDNGIGITKENLSRIYDPFFTTKAKGQGSGLGLSMVFSIVKQHQGIIDIYSEPGTGTSVKIYFPALKDVHENNQIPGPVDIAPSAIPDRAGVLIIDDEEDIRTIGMEMLTELGYTVFLAKDGHEGLKIFNRLEKEISLIILDMIMPKTSGQEILESIRSKNKKVKIIMTSGFINNENEFSRIYSKADGFLSKPFTLNDLYAIVKEYM